MRGGFSARIVRAGIRCKVLDVGEQIGLVHVVAIELFEVEIKAGGKRAAEDRKSTRLNSSHPSISYAVFCLKKKTDVIEAIGHVLHGNGRWGGTQRCVR